MFEEIYATQGWQCPICKRVYSPMTPMCLYCGGLETTTTASGSGVTYNPCSNCQEFVCDTCRYKGIKEGLNDNRRT